MRMYEIRIDKAARKFILRQGELSRKRLFNKILELKDNPRSQSNVAKMKGNNNLYRKRVGGYRIVYEINDNVLLIRIISIDNRGDIYKRY